MKPQFAMKTYRHNERGIALILVMLAVLVLSVLAAGMVFSSRSETFASYNYKLDTQADYLAKAGIQSALDFFRSADYQPLSPADQATDYQVKSSPNSVLCVSGCSSSNQQVQFVSIPGTGSSNYPSITNGGGKLVTTAFTNDLSGQRVTGDANDSGKFYVNATLLNYQTINNTTNCHSLSGWSPGSPCPVETWLITSQGVWTGGSGSSATTAKATETAVIQTVYSGSTSTGSSLTNAVYGLCSVTMNGSSGTCTDAYDSKQGPYGSNPSGSCDASAPNVIDNEAPVGSNGGVTFNGNVNTGGNVVIGTGAPSGCPSGYSGSSKNVNGKVISTSTQVLPPPLPPFSPPNSATFPTGATSYGSGQTLGPPPPVGPTGTIQPCVSSATCAGTANQPYLINSITGSATLVGGPDAQHPVVYYLNGISESGKDQIAVSGYVILDVQGSISISGQGLVSNLNNAPEQTLINDGCNNCSISLSGNGAITAVINAPNANVALSGGGSSGYMVGAIMANNITLSGGRPLHYDVELSNFPIGSSTTGKLSVPLITTYSRKKF